MSRLPLTAEHREWGMMLSLPRSALHGVIFGEMAANRAYRCPGEPLVPLVPVPVLPGPTPVPGELILFWPVLPGG
jgi:hypothetical protein